jgi:hypothetical protein
MAFKIIDTNNAKKPKAKTEHTTQEDAKRPNFHNAKNISDDC